MQILEKRFFTLLELLVVVFILSIGAVVTGIKVKNIYQEQRFLAEVDQILGHLQLAQDLMLILDTDVYFYLVKYANGTLAYYVEVEKPVVVKSKTNGLDKEASIKWLNIMERKIPLKTIRSFQFNGESKVAISNQEWEESSISKKVCLCFSLGKMSKGQLFLSASSDQVEESTDPVITLMGYPCLIKNQRHLIQEDNRLEESRLLYPNLCIHFIRAPFNY